MRVVKLHVWRISFFIAVAIFLISLLGLFLIPSPSLEPTYAVSRPLPIDYWRHMHAHPENYLEGSCAAFPRVKDLYFVAAFWQKVQSWEGNIYVYGAYWDNRFEEPVVRVLLYSEVAPLPRLYCQLWYRYYTIYTYLNDARPYSVAANATYAWVSEWVGPLNGISEPYVLACPTRPKDKTVWADDDPRLLPPRAVSVVSSPCQPANNALAVQGAPKLNREPLPRHKSVRNMSIGVCMSTLESEDDISGQLIEWLQLVKEFGADTVYVYLSNVHPNVRLVLDYYRNIGLADVTDILSPPRSYSTPAGFQSRFGEVDQMMLFWRRQMLPGNDCLYRAMHKHRWITNLNLNEMIVPVRDGSWPRLIEEEAKLEKFDVLVVDRFFFANRAGNKVLDIVVEKRKYNKIENSMAVVKRYLPRMLVQTWAVPTPAKRGTYESSFVSTSKILNMRNHLPLACYEQCHTRYVEPVTAKLHLYSSSDMEICALLELASDVDCRANLAALYSDDVLSRWNYVAKEVDNVMNKLSLNS